MRPWLVAVLVLMSLAPSAQAQEVVWERSIGWRSSDELTDVLALPDSGYVACGTSYAFGVRDVTQTPYPAVCILSILPNGDTAWFRHLEFYGASARLCRGDSEGFYMVATQDFVPPADGSDQLFLFKISYRGDVLWKRSIFNVKYPAYRLIRTSTGAFVVTGRLIYRAGSGFAMDMFVASFDTLGLVHFFERYNDNPRTFGNWIEEMPNGHYLASGAAGSRIWAVEIDTNGAEVQRQTLYQNASHLSYDQNAWVNQAPGGQFIASGWATGASTTYAFLGKFSQLSAATRVWGGEQEMIYLPPHVNADGSFVLYSARGNRQSFSKFSTDSARIWDATFSSRLGSSFVFLNAIAYNSDSSAVAVGSAEFTGAPKTDFYLCRIKNVGVPYDPSRPVATKPKHKGLPPLIAYPNPTAGSLTVHTRSREGLAVYSLSGQKLLEALPDPSGTTVVDVSGLAKGVYVLRQGENSIKVIRE